MSTLSFTIETNDRAVLSATAKMLLNLAGNVKLSHAPDEVVTVNDPAQTPPNVQLIDGSWIVDGRHYTSDQVREGGFTVEQLHGSGWFRQDIATVLRISPELVDATIDGLAEAETAEVSTQAAPSDVARDSHGMPWDARIHAGTKTTIADGSWKMKRGVDADVVEQVEAELINLMSIPSATTEPEPVVIPPPVAAEPEPVVIAPPVAEAEPATDADGMTFAEFLKACSAKMTAGETNMQRILEVANAKGIASLQLVNSRRDLIPALWAEISTHQKAAQ